jgi:menaquinol-cytochrome c reductase iron-sulfur subunit
VFSALFQRRHDEWVDLGPITAIPLKTPVKIEFVQRQRDAWVTTERRSSAWILTPNGRDFMAFDPRCTHLGCPYRWDDQQRQFLCPCHTAVFDLNGNVVTGPPPRPLDRYPCKVVADRLFILPSPTPSRA